MTPRPGSLRQRLLLGVLGVGFVSAVVASAATITGFLVLANQHPIGANRVGKRIISSLPSTPSTKVVELGMASIALLLVALAVTTALSIAQRVLRPVGDLANAADRMATGDLSVRLEPEGDDEIADVARSFNVMADNLEGSVSALQQLESTARRFAADVSHELRTPLAAMTAVTDVLSAHTAGMNAEAARATDLVVREIGHLDRLVSDLIEISRFDAGTAQLDAELVDVRAAITGSLEIRGWRSEHVQLQVEPGLSAHLDLRRFDVVVANLVGNALKYGQPPVVVAARREGESLVVEVTDRGPGIAEQALPHLFERFFKGDAARARSDGSGLGLAIALENARLHRGTLEAGNRPEGGAVFRLTLPGVPEPGAQAGHQAREPE
ncbi:MAG: two-component system, OmpR family, sensor histidine kinase MtrB [Actinomycetota bacterium]|nr:two-component system, OmpR family, sensor histidine kinase MtrB [Actinomycetota bacterium]